ncbi:class I SAM-dependent methyltransferase [Patescibacteria group bacterium]|nr:class I SAM-dependent methyltransferase [Patescibacteria group bacterium]
MFLRKKLIHLVDNAKNDNDKNILGLLEKNSNARLMDLGCDDGKWTLRLGEKVCTKNLFGIDIVDKKIQEAIKKGIECKKVDLNNDLPFEDNYFDIVHANQVIEHIYDLDKFMSEIYRVVMLNGYVIISTENLASWHNIFSLLFGWQPFSATNYLPGSIGNPLALWKNYESSIDKS